MEQEHQKTFRGTIARKPFVFHVSITENQNFVDFRSFRALAIDAIWYEVFRSVRNSGGTGVCRIQCPMPKISYKVYTREPTPFRITLFVMLFTVHSSTCFKGACMCVLACKCVCVHMYTQTHVCVYVVCAIWACVRVWKPVCMYVCAYGVSALVSCACLCARLSATCFEVGYPSKKYSVKLESILRSGFLFRSGNILGSSFLDCEYTSVALGPDPEWSADSSTRQIMWNIGNA